MKDYLESAEFFYSNNPEEIEKEKKKRKALHSLFPNSMGAEDKTNYVLLSDNKQGHVPDSLLKAPKLEPAGVEVKTDFGNNEKEFNFDPWQREKTLDRMRVIKYPKLNGELGTQILNRAPYHEEEFDYMNRAKFDSVIGHTLKSEGGYSNHPLDLGGETMRGITKSFMEDYKYALPGGKSKPIRDLTVDDARRLYKAMWDKYKLGYIRDKNLAYVLNDYMVNSYAGGVVKRVQQILNSRGTSLDVDGCMGPKTLEAIHNCDPKWLVDEIINDRYNNYRELVKKRPEQIINYAGWINRLNGVAEKVGSKIRYPIEY